MLSTKAEKRLNRIVEIQEEMSALESELETLLGGKAEEVEEDVPATRGGKKKKRKTTTCKICGKEGHTKKTCPDRDGAGSSSSDALRGQHQSGMSCCGSLGPRHKKGCPEGNKAPRPPVNAPDEVSDVDDEQPEKKREPLTPEQYAEIRSEMQDKEFQSMRYAMTHKMSPAEVNHAIKSSSYEHYLDIREE